MISPFVYADVRLFLRELNGSDDVVVVLKRAVMEFDDAFDTASEKHTLVPEEKCIRLWVSACLLDAAFNGTDYTDEESDCNDACAAAVRALQTAFAKKHFFTGKPVYDIEKIRTAVCDQLLVFEDEDTTELAKKLHQTDQYPAFSAAVSGLLERLTPESAK